MELLEQVPLASLTSLRVGGRARYVATCHTPSDVVEALSFAKEHELPLALLGGGSNVLASDDGFSGLVLKCAIDGITFTKEGSVTVGAGVSWDAFVQAVGAQGLWGIENLAGIPGTVGAAPVQNIGAYGVELKESLMSVEVYDIRTQTRATLSNDACAFGYRDSRFKHEPYIILSATFDLRTDGAPRTTYKDVMQYAAEHPLKTPLEVGEAIRSIRARKFPDIRTHGTAGSFFKNPVISYEQHAMLARSFPELPAFPAKDGVKISLAYVLDVLLELRGYRMGLVWLFDKQPLVLVADNGARAEDIEALATFVTKRVHDVLGITIEREVRSVTAIA